MESWEIQSTTIKLINGIKYLSERQVCDVRHIVCHSLSIEANEENFKIVDEGIVAYFYTQNTRQIL